MMTRLPAADIIKGPKEASNVSNKAKFRKTRIGGS
jgi:hypothetical protein